MPWKCQSAGLASQRSSPTKTFFSDSNVCEQCQMYMVNKFIHNIMRLKIARESLAPAYSVKGWPEASLVCRAHMLHLWGFCVYRDPWGAYGIKVNLIWCSSSHNFRQWKDNDACDSCGPCNELGKISISQLVEVRAPHKASTKKLHLYTTLEATGSIK